ncbi:hypothetical protein D3C81_1889040 [compost metagenome]
MRKHRITGVFRPCSSIVLAVGNTLILNGRFSFRHIQVMCEDGNQPRLISEKSRRILPVDNGTAREDHAQPIRHQRNRQLFPSHQIPAHCMAPVHLSHSHSVRVMLEEQVIFALEIYQSVRIVHPILLR